MHSRLYRVDPKTMRLTGRRSIDCSNGFCEAAVGRGSVWVAANPNAGASRLLRIDPGTLRVTDVIPALRSDLGTDFTLDGSSIWWLGSEAVRVDTRPPRIVAT